ncbi:MAG TPA: gamma-glutamylcyclotransferase family protein [Polyangiaceae bacterium]|nr:gamma-glutamylcyclotransferase family protein [Polyangiaceae bacterium]
MTTQHLYTYGTLQVAAIIEHIVGRPLRGVAARLDGYQRYRVADRVYPAIVEAVGGQVPGVLYADLEAVELERLDLYEGDLYERREVVVWVGPARLSAATYVIRSELQHRLSTEPWDWAGFLRDHLDEYLALITKTSRAP